MLGEERREYILNMIDKTGSISSNEAAKILNVSEATIRRDINKLSKKNLFRKTHGGAIKNINVGYEVKFDEQKEKFIEEKKRIALAASNIIFENDVIMIEAGTTGYQLALNLNRLNNLTIVTNSCDIAVLFEKTKPNFKVLVTGGILNTKTHSLVGPIADYSFSRLNVDKAFIGISGLDIKKGITAVDHIEADTKTNIIESTKKIIALCDYSKLGHISINYVAPAGRIDTLITDSNADKNILNQLRGLGIEIVLS